MTCDNDACADALTVTERLAEGVLVAHVRGTDVWAIGRVDERPDLRR
ncbi:hypothetical protein [Mycobacteroides abscessus]|nr:hypothetical protein [Mycobacteroides abscessus]